MVDGAFPSSRLFTNRNASFPLVHRPLCDHPHTVPRTLVGLLDSIVGLEGLDRLVVRSSLPKQRPDDREVSRERLGDLSLLIERRHPGPGVEHVGDVVGREHVRDTRGVR